jgi:hypothetical protein
MSAAKVTARDADMPAACHNFHNGQIRLESMTRCTTVVAMPMAKYRIQKVDLKIWIPRNVHGCKARTNHKPISTAVSRMQMNTNARATIHPLYRYQHLVVRRCTESSNLHVNVRALPFHFKAQDADRDDRVRHEEHLQNPEWRQCPRTPGVARVHHERRDDP